MIAMLMLNINYLAIPRNYDRRYLNIEQCFTFEKKNFKYEYENFSYLEKKEI